MALMSVLALYNYSPDIFDDYTVPEGVEKDILVSNILSECAELESLYSDPAYLKQCIGFWSKSELPTWNAVYKALTTEYNPLDNYSMYEKGKNVTNGDKKTKNTPSGSDTQETSKSAFNSTEYTPVEKQTFTPGTVQDVSEHNDNTLTIELERKGNIGVTTSQSMLQQEVDVRMKYNIYQLMTRSFKNRFCILVY